MTKFKPEPMRQRKEVFFFFFKDYGSIGKAIALRNIQSEIKENNKGGFSQERSKDNNLLTLAKRAIILKCTKDQGLILFTSSYHSCNDYTK